MIRFLIIRSSNARYFSSPVVLSMRRFRSYLDSYIQILRIWNDNVILSAHRLLTRLFDVHLLSYKRWSQLCFLEWLWSSIGWNNLRASTGKEVDIYSITVPISTTTLNTVEIGWFWNTASLTEFLVVPPLRLS